MLVITVAGPPSSGKTSLILHLADCFSEAGKRVCAVKFDCLTSFDHIRYKERNIPVLMGISGKLCPDHYFISNIEQCVAWASSKSCDVLISESAGLCNRCSPHIRGVPAICVTDNLSGVSTPRKIGPMLKLADYVVVTKGDIVSQAEREVFAYNIRQVNAKAKIVFVNGITGQGAFMLFKRLSDSPVVESLTGKKLRFTVPASLCSYCTGETRIGEAYTMGMLNGLELKEYE